MGSNVIYVRFGLRTCCCSCGKPFTPEHPDTVLCPDCPPDEHLSEYVLLMNKTNTVSKLIKPGK